jgi:hypothetical protein
MRRTGRRRTDRPSEGRQRPLPRRESSHRRRAQIGAGAQWIRLSSFRDRPLIAFDAVQFLTEPACAPFLGHDPRPLHKWTRMADVLCMAALKVGNPIVLGVSVEADNFSLHAGQGDSAPAPVHRRESRGVIIAPRSRSATIISRSSAVAKSPASAIRSRRHDKSLVDLCQ